VATLVVALKHQDQPKVWDGRIPYLGLKAFQESDAESTRAFEAQQIAVTERADAVEVRATSDFLADAAATSEAQVAELKNRIQASQLAAASDARLEKDQELALLLATARLGMSPQPDTRARFYSVIFTPFRRSLEGHEGSVWSASFSPDGQRIVTASEDGRAKVWAIYPSIADKLAVARAQLSGGFSDDECLRFFRDDLENCPRELEQLYALFEDDVERP
jgi:hypothetical protein